ncbi:tubulin-like doman-containing protein [Nostoc sp.]|uniref:tubulin-like doman-containing protein n=1 Tax=Nostoc sp. TaxID=1180 RepID=UPI003593CF4F
MTLYIVGIGGTGAKCVEAVIHLAAVGLFTEEPIKLLFIDADESNGNLERARTSLSIYQKCFELLKGEKQQSSWMKTPIESSDLWSPFNQKSINKNLGSFYGYNNLKQNYQVLGNLFDILYTKNEREVELDVGFRGRPAIGSAIMSQIDLDALDEEPWRTIINQIQGDVGAGKQVKIFLCGSIFGGTGASGLPTIGRLIANKLKKSSIRDRVKIACLFVLPYFNFSPEAGEDPNEVYAQADLFLLNTEAALRYYENQAQEIFDTVYLLGNQNSTQVKFSIGKKTQRNQSHFLELYAATAARQFLLNTPKSGTVMLVGREGEKKLSWSDIPEENVIKSELVNATRFAYAWRASTASELANAKEKGIDWAQRYINWFSRFYRPNAGMLGKIFDKKGEELPDFADPKEQAAVRIVTNWCQDYLRWLHDLHICQGDDIQLFVSRSFTNFEGQLKQEEFSSLVMNDSRPKDKQLQDTVQRLHVSLTSEPRNLNPPNQGTAGLSKALYILCRL